MGGWKPWSLKDLLAAHRLLLDGLAEDAGKLRTRGVGVAKGGVLVHLAPPAAGVAGLMRDLLGWLKKTDVHPLVAGSVCHYELEFIHPFSDGNGRIGRLWQTLILSRWDPLLGFLPVESVVRERQDEYYRILAVCDKAGNSTAFIEFMLGALLAALRDARRTDQVGDQVSDQVSEQVSEQVKGLLGCLVDGPRSARECMDRLGLCHRPTFRANYLNPALAAGLIELTVPDKPRSRLQQYRLARNRT
jgi:Fic family protein